MSDINPDYEEPVEIPSGYRFSYKSWCDGTTTYWTCGGYIYYSDCGLYYTCVSDDGEERDFCKSEMRQEIREAA